MVYSFNSIFPWIIDVILQHIIIFVIYRVLFFLKLFIFDTIYGLSCCKLIRPCLTLYEARYNFWNIPLP
jgi:hypothetical protein